MSARFRPQLNASLFEGWFAKESITLLAPDGQANVIASSEPLTAEIDTEQYANIQGDLLRKEFPGYHEFQFGPTEVFGDRRGYMRRFQWTPPDGVPVVQMQLYYSENGRGFTATATTPSSQVDRYELDLRQTLGALRIESEAPLDSPTTPQPAQIDAEPAWASAHDGVDAVGS